MTASNSGDVKGGAVIAGDVKRSAYAQLCMVADALDLGDGDFEEMKAALLDKLRAAWSKDGYRLNLVHIENVNAAYVRSTVAVLDTPEVRQVWPYWMFSAIMDSKTSRHCENLNGVVRPAGESWWYDGRIPPLHFGGCRSVIEPLTLDQAHKIGVTTFYPMSQGDHDYGKMGEWEPSLEDFPPELVAIYEKAVGKF